ncbi:Serine protease 55, partial [Leptosomus discolor]
THTQSKAGEFPWHVCIQSNGRHICGGTKIIALWILTVAHCFAEELQTDLTVVVGGTGLNVTLEEHKPDRLILHENFHRISMQNDIALIPLCSPMEFSNEKIPICLPFICGINTWQHCQVAGWETTTVEVPASHVLQKAQLKLVSREQRLEQIPQLEENVLWAELEKAEKGTCQVESREPLVCSYWNTMKWFQVGIVS